MNRSIDSLAAEHHIELSLGLANPALTVWFSKIEFAVAHTKCCKRSVDPQA